MFLSVELDKVALPKYTVMWSPPQFIAIHAWACGSIISKGVIKDISETPGMEVSVGENALRYNIMYSEVIHRREFVSIKCDTSMGVHILSLTIL